MHVVRCFRSRRYARLWIVSRNLSLRRRHQAHGASGIVAPAIWIGKFFADVMQPGALIFQAGAVALIKDRRGYKDEQIAFRAGVEFFLEEITQERHIAQERHFGATL